MVKSYKTKNIEYLDSSWGSDKALEQEAIRFEPTGVAPFLIRSYFKWVGRLFPEKAAKFAYKLFSTPRSRAVHKTIDQDLRAAVQSLEQIDGQKIALYEWGSGDRIILLIHGWESRGTALRGFAMPMVAKGYKVIAFDAPAHGDSSGKSTNIQQMAKIIDYLMRKHPTIDQVITHSFGGAALTYCLKYFQPQKHLRNAIMIAAPESGQQVVENAIKLMHLPPVCQDLFVEEVRKRIDGRAIEQLSIAENLKHLSVDNLYLFHDVEDAISPLQGALNMLDQWEDAHLIISKGYGHFRLTKNPLLKEKIFSILSN